MIIISLILSAPPPPPRLLAPALGLGLVEVGLLLGPSLVVLVLLVVLEDGAGESGVVHDDGAADPGLV